MINELVTQLLEDAKPPSGVVELQITKNVKAKFKVLNDMTERAEIERTVADWAKKFSKTFADNRAMGAYKTYGTADIGVLAQVKFVEMLCLTEELKSETVWLQIAKEAAPVLAGLVDALDKAASNSTSSEWATYVDEKKDLPQTSPTLPSAE